MVEKVSVRGVLFDNLTLDEAADRAFEMLRSDGVHIVYTPNSEIVQMCIEKNEFYDLINSADMCIPDGIGVVKAARILGTPLKTRVAGIELGEEMLKRCAGDKTPVFFMGSKAGVAEAAAERMCAKYPGLFICGTHDGYFKKEGAENDSVIKQINDSGAKLLFVCLGVPAQEKWICENKDKLESVTLALCLGGSLDGYAGCVKRAPKIFIKFGLEWFYRLCKEPWRIGRMMKLPKFYFGTYRAKFRERKNKSK